MTNAVVFARMPKQDAELVKKIAEDRGEKPSDFAKRPFEIHVIYTKRNLNSNTC